jgi:predicted nucleic acid-binding protein
MVAFDLREKYSLSFWDSIIVASALNSNCNILASEDMQDGLRIKNPRSLLRGFFIHSFVPQLVFFA